MYYTASGQPYTAVQNSLNCNSGGGACESGAAGSPYDGDFNNAFVLPDGALRPYLGNISAPADTVGIFAGDACRIYGITGNEPFCNSAIANSLISLNKLNATGAASIVTNKDVRFMANTATSNLVFGTPFGNVGRNTLRDAITNTGNFGLFKMTNITERVRVQFHMTMFNVFNHPNFGSIDPFVDDAGLTSEGIGFANPLVQNGGSRRIRFGLKISF